MTMTEKILAAHSGQDTVKPGDIIDVVIDARVARDFGGANVVKNINDYDLGIEDPSRTFFTFDCNPTGSDQKYTANQHTCRVFARNHGIKVYDINKGIGTHILIEEGLAFPGSTAVSTDSHANILGAIGAFGQGMGDKDIAAAWSKGKVWFKVPASVKIYLKGKFPDSVSAKDIVLNLLFHFGPEKLLGYAVEIYGDDIDHLSLDDRITISSMATEMGAIIILFPPNKAVMRYCRSRTRKHVEPVAADSDAEYAWIEKLNATEFNRRVSLPGQPADAVEALKLEKIRIDSVFIGSCTNGRISDMRAAAGILRGRKVAEGVILKIVPSTDLVWQRCLDEGLIDVFKEAGAMVSNAGCAGCAAGQVGQNGPGEVSVSTGNRNFPGKQGKGDVYLASPEVAAASAIAGFITTPDRIPDEPLITDHEEKPKHKSEERRVIPERTDTGKPVILKGRAWLINKSNIDTDMIYHNRYLAVTELSDMGKYTFDNLEGYTTFAEKALKGDIIFTGSNFGAGSSRQQAVDCFISLGIQALVAGSFGAIYERNAINAGFPVFTSAKIDELGITDGDEVMIDLKSGEIKNISKKTKIMVDKFSEVQMEIYQNGGLF